MKPLCSYAAAAGALLLCFPLANSADAHSDRQIQEEIGFEQRIGEALPAGLAFTDSNGEKKRLDEIVGDRPALLVMAWYSCKTLCPILLRNLGSALSALDFAPGRDFDVVAVSIDPREGEAEARKAREALSAAYGAGEEPDWHVLTGKREQIDRLAEAVGFQYAYDAEQESYAHPAGLVFVTAEGTISRYLFGLENAPQDVKFALMETSDGALGSASDRIALRCHRFDPETGEYTFAVMNALRIAGGGMAVLLFGTIGWWIRRERRSGRRL